MDKCRTLIAKYIGTPIDSNLPNPVALEKIADFETAEPGEKVYTVVPDDGNGVDTVYTMDSNGTITTVKIAIGTPTELTFAHIQSKLEYVLIKEVLDNPDQTALARRKAAMSRALDKIEVKRVLDTILAVSGQEVAQASGDDIYTLIKKMVRKIEDYGDNFILLCGTTAWAAISDYDKDNADSFNYNVKINEMLKEEGIEKVKMVGNITLDSGSNLAVLNASKMILVARNSQLQKGKPVVFVRRLLNQLIIENSGAEVTPQQRALWVAETPSVLYSGTTQTSGFGIFAYESIIHALLNYRATCWATYA